MKFKNKFQPKFIGPYPVEKVINPVAVCLNFPDSLKIHPVFNVSLVKPVRPGTLVPRPPNPVLIVGDEEFEVKAILDSKRIWGRLHYLIDWKGYGPESRS